MTDTFVKSYLKINDRFIPVQEFSGEFPDKHYINGAIVLTIDGRSILTFEHWDLVDQLWCYVADGICKLRKGEKFETYFPDQPLLLRFEPVNKRFVRVTVGNDTHELATETFLKTLQRGAKEFFQRMRELLPDWNDTWERYEKAAGI